jgi:hypothetical protein
VIKDKTLVAAASENFIGNAGVDILLYLQRCLRKCIESIILNLTNLVKYY